MTASFVLNKQNVIQSIGFVPAISVIASVYLSTQMSRFLMIFLLYPVLHYTGYEINLKEAFILAWSGMRGTVSLILILLLDESAVDPTVQGWVTLVSVGTIMLTSLVNGLTTGLVVKWLGLMKSTESSPLVLSTVQILEDNTAKLVANLKHSEAYAGAQWQIILDKMLPNLSGAMCKQLNYSICPIEPPLAIPALLEGKQQGSVVAVPDVELAVPAKNHLDAELTASEEANRCMKLILFRCMRAQYYHLSRYENIDPRAISALITCAHYAGDALDVGKHWELLTVYTKPPSGLPLLRLCPVLKSVQDVLVFQHYRFALDIADGFIRACRSALPLLKLQFPADKITQAEYTALDQIARDTEAVEALALSTWQEIEELFPEIYSAIRTLHAARRVMLFQKQSVEKLIHQGLLSYAIGTRLKNTIEVHFHHWPSTLQMIFQSKTEEMSTTYIIQHLPLFDDLPEEMMERVCEQKKQTYERGAVVCSDNLLVITRGVLAFSDSYQHLITEPPTVRFVVGQLPNVDMILDARASCGCPSHHHKADCDRAQCYVLSGVCEVLVIDRSLCAAIFQYEGFNTMLWKAHATNLLNERTLHEQLPNTCTGRLISDMCSRSHLLFLPHPSTLITHTVVLLMTGQAVYAAARQPFQEIRSTARRLHHRGLPPVAVPFTTLQSAVPVTSPATAEDKKQGLLDTKTVLNAPSLCHPNTYHFSANAHLLFLVKPRDDLAATVASPDTEQVLFRWHDAS
jgi:hypothetical protein